MNLQSVLLLPWFWYILWGVMIPVCLTIIPPKPCRRYISCAILFGILTKAQFFYHIDSESQYASIPLILQGVLLNLYFYTFNLFFLVEYPEFTDYRPGVETLDQVRALKPCTWEKFKWCCQRSILVTLMGHGWNWQISDSKGYKRSISNVEWLKTFFIKKLIIGYTIYDIFFHLYLSTEVIQTRGWGEGHTKDLVFFAKESQLSILKQGILALGTAYCIYFGIVTLYSIAIFMNVFLFKTAELQDYPELFGSFQGDYTVKSLWGNVWHKLMYQLAVPQSKLIAGCDYKSKHLDKNPRYGTEVWRKYVMFFFVFVFTGIFHAAGTLNMPWSFGARYNINAPFVEMMPHFMSRCFYSLLFFPLQFALIIFETGVQLMWNKFFNIKVPKILRIIIGLTWIGLSEAFFVQLYIDELVKSGFDITELVVPYTPVHYLFNYFQIKL